MRLLLLLLAGCGQILGLPEPGTRPFEHRAHLLQGVGCPTCHPGTANAGDTDPVALPKTDKCLECHKQPHDRRDCNTCHGQSHIEDRAQAARVHLKFAHDRHSPRLTGNCARCHVDAQRDDVPLLPSMATCLGCHQHRDQFVLRDCQGCHVDLVRDRVPPESHLVHDADFGRSHGAKAASARELCAACHSETACASCHGVSVPVLSARYDFSTPKISGLHRAGFLARHALEARTEPGLCVTCHQPERCQECHADRGLGPSSITRNYHPAGWIGLTPSDNRHGVAARLDPLSCASCHGGAGEALCVRCHQVGGVGGSVHPPGWKSRLDQSRDLPCRLCHGPL